MDCNKLDAIYMPIDEIIPDPKNERIHDEDNVKLLKKGLKKFRQQKPITISDDKKIIAGHGIYYAAIEAGWKHINVIVSDLKNKDVDAYRVFDNKSAEKSIWDHTKLAETIKLLNAEDYAMVDYGFEDYNIDGSNQDDEFQFKEPNENPTETDKKLQLVVTFTSEDDQKELFDELLERGYKVKV